MAYAMMGLAALAGGIIQPLTGFGAAVIMMVAASAFYDMTIAPTIVALICMAQSGTMTWMYRKHIDVKQIALPIGLYTACSLVIINLLGNFDLHVLTALFGGVPDRAGGVLPAFCQAGEAGPARPGGGAGVQRLLRVLRRGVHHRRAYDGAVFRRHRPEQGDVCRQYAVPVLYHQPHQLRHADGAGLFQRGTAAYGGLGMVCILLGLWIGTRLSRKMSGDVARQVVYIGVGVSGLVTLVQELMK